MRSHTCSHIEHSVDFVTQHPSLRPQNERPRFHLAERISLLFSLFSSSLLIHSRVRHAPGGKISHTRAAKRKEEEEEGSLRCASNFLGGREEEDPSPLLLLLLHHRLRRRGPISTRSSSSRIVISANNLSSSLLLSRV